MPSKGEQAWLGLGIVAGACVVRLLQRLLSERKPAVSVTTPRRVFKLATASEVRAFRSSGQINSSLDISDGFVHLSDKTSCRKVALCHLTEVHARCTELILTARAEMCTWALQCQNTTGA